MALTVNFYDLPRMVERASPGLIVEAMPNASATSNGFHGGRILTEPTGTYGYVMGVCLREVWELPHVGGAHELDPLVQKVLSSSDDVDAFFRARLGDWVDGDKTQRAGAKGYAGPVIAIGELSTDSFYAGEPELRNNLMNNAIILSPPEVVELQRQIIEYHHDRRPLKYLFVTPSGERVPLSEMRLEVDRK